MQIKLSVKVPFFDNDPPPLHALGSEGTFAAREGAKKKKIGTEVARYYK